MDQYFEHKGKWFLPDDPDNVLSGILKFDPKEDIRLELIGAFDYNLKKIQVIWGIIPGKYVTLYNCFEIRRENMLGDPELGTFACNFVLIGAHFRDTNDIKFNKSKISYSHLDDWANISTSFKIGYDHKKYKTSIEYTLPEPVDVQLSPKLKLTLNTTAKLPTRKMVQKEAAIRQKTFINFESIRKLPFDKVLNNAFHFQNFLTLVTQKPIYIKEFFAYFKIGNKKKFYEVQVFFHVSNLPKYDKELLPIDMLVPYNCIATKFDSIIKQWFDKQTLFDPIYSPFFSIYYAPFLYTSDKFLNLTRSLEAFHRDTVRRNAYFKTRMLEIFRAYSKAYNSTLQIKSKPQLAEKVKKYRNDFTHSNPILTSKDRRYLDTHFVSEKLKLIATCAILHAHGLTLKELKSFIENSRLYTHYRHKIK